jgi:hypothetical protein
MRVAVPGTRRSLAVLAMVVAAILGVAWFLLGPGEAPAGQPSLVTLDLDSLDALRAEFNRDSKQARVIVLLSPT